MPSRTTPAGRPDPLETLGARLPREWNRLDDAGREQWLKRAGARVSDAAFAWSQLGEELQTKVIQMYLRAGGPKQSDQKFVGTVIEASPSVAARVMFSHQLALVMTEDSAGRHEGGQKLEQDRGVEQSSDPAARTQGIRT